MIKIFNRKKIAQIREEDVSYDKAIKEVVDVTQKMIQADEEYKAKLEDLRSALQEVRYASQRRA